MKRVWIIFQKGSHRQPARPAHDHQLGALGLYSPRRCCWPDRRPGRTLNVNPEEKPLRLPVSGAEYAPGLISFLKQNNVEIVPAPADPARGGARRRARTWS